MEKKNNQMVDKEKELKNVAPDTDVAPDVTDASSFQGGPSHTSSNRQQMRLINRIDYYKWKINLLEKILKRVGIKEPMPTKKGRGEKFSR